MPGALVAKNGENDENDNPSACNHPDCGYPHVLSANSSRVARYEAN